MKLLNTGLAGMGVLLAVIAISLALKASGASGTPVGVPELSRDLDRANLSKEIDSLRAEMRELKADLAERPQAEAAAVESLIAPEGEPDAGAAAPTDELLELGRKVIAVTASPEESARFWGLARSEGLVDRLLTQLEGEVDGAPRDVDARLRLADAFVLKLFTVPAGPEMARWGEKACDQWREILEIEPDHWKARFSIAVSLSYHPDVAGKGPEAIRELEHLVRQQEAMAPEPRHGDVYRLLATLYQRQGNGEGAGRVLRLGLARHPDDAKIQQAVEAIAK